MILVTGGSGLLGRHLITRCLQLDLPVRALARGSAPPELVSSHGWYRADITVTRSVEPALQGIRTVVHTAALLPSSVATKADYDHTNVEGTVTLARAARTAGVRHFILVSTAGVYGGRRTETPRDEDSTPNPDDNYSMSKLSAEQRMQRELDDSAVRWTILRSTGILGSDRTETSRLFHDVARRWIWAHGLRRVIVHPVHVNDVVQAVLLAVSQEGAQGEILNIGGDRALPFEDLIALIGDAIGRKPWQPRLPAILRATSDRSVSIDKARRLLGFEPMPLHSAIATTALELGLVDRT